MQACALPLMFDPNQFQTMSSGTFIKKSGNYGVIITDAAMKAVQGNNAAHYLQLTMEITDGELTGQSFIDRLNLNNPKDSVREMAFKSLTSYATAIGQNQAFQDANVLLRRPFRLYVEATEEVSTTDPNKSNWNNSVKKWFYADGNEVQQGKYGSLQAAGTPPQQGYGAPQGGVPTPQPTAPAPTAPAPQGGYATPQGAPQVAPAGYAAPQGAPQGYAAPQGAPQGAPAAPVGQVTMGYAAPQGAAPQGAPQGAPAGYVPPAAPSFQVPQ